MKRHSRPIRIALRIALPPLSDQGVVDILEFLHEAIECFESRYFVQIRSYYDERSRHNRRSPPPLPVGTDDDPF